MAVGIATFRQQSKTSNTGNKGSYGNDVTRTTPVAVATRALDAQANHSSGHKRVLIHNVKRMNILYMSFMGIKPNAIEPYIAKYNVN